MRPAPSPLFEPAAGCRHAGRVDVRWRMIQWDKNADPAGALVARASRQRRKCGAARTSPRARAGADRCRCWQVVSKPGRAGSSRPDGAAVGQHARNVPSAAYYGGPRGGGGEHRAATGREALAAQRAQRAPDLAGGTGSSPQRLADRVASMLDFPLAPGGACDEAQPGADGHDRDPHERGEAGPVVDTVTAAMMADIAAKLGRCRSASRRTNGARDRRLSPRIWSRCRSSSCSRCGQIGRGKR